VSKILIAMDSFKGTLSAPAACAIVASAFKTLKPNVNLSIKPVADGGEGTADVIVRACGGQWFEQTVVGPLPEMKVSAGFGYSTDESTAIVEMAKASGLECLRENQKNPALTTTYGTGQLIDAACKQGAKRILLAVGGSATVDGGTGAARALGWRFLDQDGKDVSQGGGSLTQIRRMVPPQPPRNLPEIMVLCDVDSPLCGPTGAAMMFARQKGAEEQLIEQLEKGLLHLATLIKEQTGKDVQYLPGAGAAGRLAAGAVAFLGGRLTSGFATIRDCLNLQKEIADADWVITGEGSFDLQSLRGKVVGGITKEAVRLKKNLCDCRTRLFNRAAIPPRRYRSGSRLCRYAYQPGRRI